VTRTNPRVAIVILHLDQHEALVACLESCRKIAYGNYEVIVVENGSPAGSPWRQATGLAADVRVIRSSVNLGYAKGNNLGIREACRRGADYVLLLNDDAVVVMPEFLGVLVDVGERAEGVGALGPVVVHADDPTRIAFAGARFDGGLGDIQSFEREPPALSEGATLDSDYVTGCALLMRRAAIELVGLLDESFFLYWEDTDWGLRVKASGLRNVVVPAARVGHRVSATVGGLGSPLRVYHRTRSHLRFAWRHAPGALARLHRRFGRDVAWLALKSTGPDRVRAARAILAALRDYHLGRTDAGPRWIWRSREDER
jgi:GT2 family glycosyltransferase